MTKRMPSQTPRSGTWGHIVLGSGQERPFLVVEYHPAITALPDSGVPDRPARIFGWLFHDPAVDQHDTLLREAGIAVQDRTRPCYLSVPMSRWRLR